MKLPSATPLRLFAAWLVVATHSWKLSSAGAVDPCLRLTGEFEASHLGLAIFFVLSGFLVAGSAARCAGPLDFASRRVRRIVPGWILCMVLVVFAIGPACSRIPLEDYLSADLLRTLVPIVSGSAHWDLPGVFTEHLFRSANGSVWTIPYEILLYGLLGAAFFLLPRRGEFGSKILPVVLWVTLVAMLASSAGREIDVERRILGFRLAYLLPFAAWFVAGWTIQSWRPMRSWLLAATLVGLPLWIGAWGTPWCGAVEAFVLPCAVLLAASSGSSGRREIPDISYGFYLWGWPVQQVLLDIHPGLSGPGLLVASTFATLLPATLSWYLVEKRFLSRRVAL